MNVIPSLGSRLRQARDLEGLSQFDAAEAAGVAREVISYWENGRRVPSIAQLRLLAEAYGVSADSLLGNEPESEVAAEHQLFFRGISGQSSESKQAVRRWLAFLDDWAELLRDAGDQLPGRQIAPNREWRAPQAITDSRHVPYFVESVRKHYALGEDAIPDLLAFHDQLGILVYRIPLDGIGEGEGVSGLFYNHPQLGFTILVNTNTTPGRQSFTLAHELAHALFHYQERGLVSRTKDTDRKERFANAFAAHFLVPGGKLHELVALGPDGAEVSPYDVLRLQRYFRVSYATMLNRLRNEGLLSQANYEQYREYSPSALARNLGLDVSEYVRLEGDAGVSLASYPTSVLERVRRFILDDQLTPLGAADLLDVSVEEIQQDLMAFTQASNAELAEFEELPAPNAPRSRRKTAVG